MPLCFFHNVFCCCFRKEVRSTCHVECFLDMIDPTLFLRHSVSPGGSETNGIPPPIGFFLHCSPLVLSILWQLAQLYGFIHINIESFLTIKLPESTNMRRIWVSPLLGAGDPHPNKSGRQTGIRHGRVLVRLAKMIRFPKQYKAFCFHHTGVAVGDI